MCGRAGLIYRPNAIHQPSFALSSLGCAREIVPFKGVDRAYAEEEVVPATARAHRSTRTPRGPRLGLRNSYQIKWLLARDEPTEVVAMATVYTYGWVRRVARRYNEGGAEGLGDRRHRSRAGFRKVFLQAFDE